ncbi:hypothetical protein F2P81_018338 [Scophthalmus maximus]|uniref:Phospholipid scramblase n=1 Tax=Scophthalmus maximus TaxID=52904 RepID=A0A6A4S4F1_SCOMX|nr:hypothetical protein F2P81_018338 [Scophthalmus maximus]
MSLCRFKPGEKLSKLRAFLLAPGFRYPGAYNQTPYPMPQHGGQSVAPYPVPAGGYGDPGQAPPPGFNMGYNAGPPPPVMYQPGPVGPAPVPEYGGSPGAISPAPLGAPASAPVGVPPGLEYLTQIDQILIHQKVELLEAFLGFETNNEYEIKNSLGQKIYKAKEKNDCCTRNCCGSLRSFDMKIKDTMDREVIRLIRPFRCVSCCYRFALRYLRYDICPMCAKTKSAIITVANI